MTRTIRMIAAALCVCPLVFAQADANRGQIVGTVYDAKQAVVPNAAVKIRNVATGFGRDLNTNDQGQYRAVQLDPGRYEVTAEAQGFAPTTVAGVTVTVGSAIGLDITLQVQGTTTRIEVAETLINVALPAPSAVVNADAIVNLPINGRRFQDFATLTPSVQADLERGQLSFAGQRGINSNVMLDGADYNQPFFGGIRGGERSGSIITIPQSAIQEFQAVTTGYAAEYGRSTGGILNAVTKSGANGLNGDAFYQIRHKSFGVENPFQQKSLETLHQYGGSAGGPLKKDRMFWFAALEQQRAKQPRDVLFTAIQGLAPNANTQEALNFFRGLEQRYTQTNDAWALTGRTDYQFAAGHRLTMRYNFSDANAENAVSVGNALTTITNRALSNDGIENDRIHMGSAQFTTILSPAAVNDLKVTVSAEERPRLSNAQSPQVDARPVGFFGSRNFLPTTQDDRRYQIADSFSLTRGTHTFKFGTDYNRVVAGQAFGFNQYGSFFFLTQDVPTLLDILGAGGSIANRFDHPAVRYQRQIGNLLAEMGVHQLAFFGQDSWRLNNKLTLDFGLRWEGQWNPQPEATNTALADRIRGVRFPNGATVDPTRFRNNLDQIMPRFGFAYSPFTSGRRTVIRGHAGMFYASTPLLLYSDGVNNFRQIPGNVSIEVGTAATTVYQAFRAAGVDLNATPLDRLPIIPVETVQRAIAAGTGAAPDPFRNANVTTMASDFRNPRSFQTGVGFESEIVTNLVAGAQFNYVNTVHLQRNRNYNLAIPAVRPVSVDAALRPFFTAAARPVQSLNLITVRESSARQMYRGATFSGQYRVKRFQFNAYYTLSENFSDDDNERTATTFFHDNAFDFKPEYNYSRLDARHQFTSNAVVRLPLGFEMSMIYRATSGFPIDAIAGADLNGDGQNTADRPYSAPGVSFLRNSFRNRSVHNVDFRVLKNFPLWSETARLQLSCEMFNLFNADNVVFADNNTERLRLRYGTGIDSRTGQAVAPVATFMQLRRADGSYNPGNIQVGTPFQAQLGLRLFF